MEIHLVAKRGKYLPFLEQANSSSNGRVPGAFSGSRNRRGEKAVRQLSV